MKNKCQTNLIFNRVGKKLASDMLVPPENVQLDLNIRKTQCSMYFTSFSAHEHIKEIATFQSSSVNDNKFKFDKNSS